jgi:hypothetical protein
MLVVYNAVSRNYNWQIGLTADVINTYNDFQPVCWCIKCLMTKQEKDFWYLDRVIAAVWLHLV